MRRKLLRYLANKYDFDLIPKNIAAVVPEPGNQLLDNLRNSFSILSHPLGGRLPESYGTIPRVGKRLYFRSSVCTAADFRNEAFDRWRREIGEAPRLHRKIWEHVFIAAHLEAAGVLKPGCRGLGFGVGQEPLPAAFAARGAAIVATDMAPDAATAAGWIATAQHASSLDQLNQKGLCPPDKFRELVSFRTCDMTNIPGDLRGFDFCWSSCSFEHLGSIRAGLDFVHASVGTLKPGGVAIHTTEYNLSSDDATIDDNPMLVLFRRRDITQLVDELKSRDHHVAEVCFDLLTEPIDLFVDLPPFKAESHIRLQLANFVSTSIGLVIQRAD